MCGLVVSTEGDRVTSIRGDVDDPFSRGHICPKGHALRDLHDDPDRLRRPMRRVGARWEPVEWDAALDEVSDRLAKVGARHGQDAVGLYEGNPTAHDHGAVLGIPALLGVLGTHNHFNSNSQDSNPKLYACLKMFGSAVSLTVPDIDRTSHLLLLGANPVVSNGSTMSLGDVRRRLRAVRERGGRMVLVDPRRNETAAWCDEHVFIRPGGDAALLLAILHVLFAENRIDERAVSRIGRGVDVLRELVRPFPPARVERAIGIPADSVSRLAREFSDARTAVAYARIGVCQNAFGLVGSWLVEALNVVTGNFDRPGGAMFASPAADIGALERRIVGAGEGRWRSRVRGLPECVGALPSAVIAEEMRTPGPGQIRGFICLAGNPVLSTPNGPRLDEALTGLDIMVSIDPYINETSRHAHFVLPPVSPLERPHFDLLFQGLAVRNVARYSEPVFVPAPGARTDYDILTSLAARIAARRIASGRLARSLGRALERAVPSPEFWIDALIRLGPYGARGRLWQSGLTLAEVRKSAHGRDLGALVPSRISRVHTPDGLVDLAPASLVRDVCRVAAWVDSPPRDSLVLIGRRHLRSNNSWMHNCPSLVKGPDRATLLIHSSDASRLGVVDGANVGIASSVGQVTARATVTDDVMPGVVSLPHGYGHSATANTQRIAGTLPGPNVNVLTSELDIEPLIGNSILTGVAVRVEAIDP